MQKINDWVKRLTENGGARKLIFAAGAAGIALILLSGLFSFNREPDTSDTGFSVQDYRQTAQQDLETLISHIQGAGKTRVMLTVENSAQYVYLENGTTKTEEIQPRVRGVLVLCEGGEDPMTVGRVTEAVTKALDISTAKVCIEKLTE